MYTQKRVIRTYLKRLKRLPGGRDKNAEYRNYIRGSIQEVFAAHPDTGEQAVRELLGAPETARNSYIQNLSPEELECGRKERKRARNRWLAFLIPAAVLLLFTAGLFVRCYYFPVIRVAIGRPVVGDADTYLEKPMLVGTGSIFGQSPRITVYELMFLQNCDFMTREFERKYPNGHHISCTVKAGKGETVIVWTGTGITEDGITEEVQEQYVCPYQFQLPKSYVMTGEAAERVRQAEESLQRMID